MDAALPLRSSILPRAAAGVVFNLPTDERRRVFRTSAGRADIHSLPAAGKSAVRNNHRFGRKGDNRGEAVSLLQLPEVYQFNILGFNHRLNAVITRRKTEPKKRSSMPRSGWPPCAPTSRTGGSRWSGTMGITVMSPGARLIQKIIEDEDVIEKILKHLGLWDLKVRLPPKMMSSFVRISLAIIKIPMFHFLSLPFIRTRITLWIRTGFQNGMG